jgi:YegS/Rv2252/BmrU family lipid kinase
MTMPSQTVSRRRVLVVHNPTAGGHQGRRFQDFLACLAEIGVDASVRPTAGPADAMRIARSALDEGWDAIVAAGGDGTVNEVINGLSGGALCLAVFPMGTANVLALELDLPSEPRAAADLVASGESLLVHLPVVNGRSFILMAGVGFDAQVVAAVTPKLKKMFGKLAYVWKTLIGFRRYSRTLYRIDIDGAEHRAASAVIANGRLYGGRYSFAPEARLDSPLLHVCLLEKTGAWNAIRYAIGLVFGRLSRYPDVSIVTGRSIHIDGDPSQPVQADGDIIGRLPVDIEAAQASVRIICPRVQR